MIGNLNLYIVNASKQRLQAPLKGGIPISKNDRIRFHPLPRPLVDFNICTHCAAEIRHWWRPHDRSRVPGATTNVIGWAQTWATSKPERSYNCSRKSDKNQHNSLLLTKQVRLTQLINVKEFSKVDTSGMATSLLGVSKSVFSASLTYCCFQIT